ncbi:MAG: hypothetical protein HC828_13240 [Blastochloris sp.]|nr:hypothetical protein [Blastochloris sp.]
MRGLMLLALIVLLAGRVAAQADDPHQFLYRDGDRLMLVDLRADPPTVEALPGIEAAELDHYEWSADGRYLSALQQESETFTNCLNIYDVDELVWLYDEPIACSVTDAALAPASENIAYATYTNYNGQLWLYSLSDDMVRALDATTYGDDSLYDAQISDIGWSPSGRFVTYEHRESISGGSVNILYVLDLASRVLEPWSVAGEYYAGYNPIWSPDDAWFLLVIQEQYVTSGSLPLTNHRGDLYLINAAERATYRLTYTPALSEYNIGWTPDGEIIYTAETITQLSIDEGMRVPEVPREQIVQPEEYDRLQDSRSPDGSIGIYTFGSESTRTLQFESVEVSLDVPLSDSYDLIGWRPPPRE